MADTAPQSKPAASAHPISPFLRIPPTISPDSTCPSIIHLKRDHHIAVNFSQTDPPSVVRTRFGEFQHTSFLGQPFGSQIRASTKSNSHNGRKRKRLGEEKDKEPEPEPAPGFVHVLAPTAELWTASLPHRTQVVYTPDSSYVLHRLGVKAGSVVLEAGAGSGSFTHASVRAVYKGYPEGEGDDTTKGKVWSFEFHKERSEKLREEIANHGLDTLVEVTHQDVCKDGFLVSREGAEAMSPGATAVFLDLPAPWLALPHLTRHPIAPSSNPPTPVADPTATITIPLQSLLDPASASTPEISVATNPPNPDTPTTLSPLSPDHAVRICCFSPCMEQVTRTVAVLRQLGWLDIEMEEVQHTRVEVRRQTQKGYEEGAGPRTIVEALARLHTVNNFRDARRDVQIAQAKGEEKELEFEYPEGQKRRAPGTKKDRDPDQGRLITRVEPEVKTHTSYLTFATLPREWGVVDEEECAEYVKSISTGVVKAVIGEKEKKWKPVEGAESKRAKKKREREERKAKDAADGTTGDNAEAAVKEDDSMDVDVDA